MPLRRCRSVRSFLAIDGPAWPRYVLVPAPTSSWHGVAFYGVPSGAMLSRVRLNGISCTDRVVVVVDAGCLFAPGTTIVLSEATGGNRAALPSSGGSGGHRAGPGVGERPNVFAAERGELLDGKRVCRLPPPFGPRARLVRLLPCPSGDLSLPALAARMEAERAVRVIAGHLSSGTEMYVASAHPAAGGRMLRPCTRAPGAGAHPGGRGRDAAPGGGGDRHLGGTIRTFAFPDRSRLPGDAYARLLRARAVAGSLPRVRTGSCPVP